MPIKASAPGSVMITGEHAVVYGHRAIVAAIEQHVTVTLSPRTDRRVSIQSEIADPLETTIEALPEGGAYRFVLAAIARYARDMPSGCDLKIKSAINPTLGLGSSAAVTIACLGTLARFAGQSTAGLHGRALSIIRALQGRGSGADLAASLHGGMVAYRTALDTTSADIQVLPLPPDPLSLRYAGYKTPTGDVLALIAARMAEDGPRYAALYEAMGATSEEAIASAEQEAWPAFYDGLTAYQTHMAALGVSDDTLDHIIAGARQVSATKAAKISGSGLGDCVLAFGPSPPDFTPAQIAQKGLTFDD